MTRATIGARGGGEPWLLAAIVLALLLLFSTPRLAGQEIVVGPGQAVTRIADAIAMAGPGERIRILPGTYREAPIRVDRSVTLVGEGWPVLDGGGNSTVLEITADDVEVRGLRILGAGASHVRENAAIHLGQVRGCLVEDNRLDDNFFGVYLARTRDCRIAGNVIRASGTRESTSGNGIHLWNASDIRVEGNRISGHRDGIYLEFANGTAIRDNQSEDNLRYGLHFMFSNDTEYTGNVFRRNSAGVAVMYTKRATMRGNRFEDSWGAASYGLLLKEITDSEITGNVFRRNTVGIYAEGSSGMAIHGNDFVRNGWALRLRSNTRENRFTDNNFVDNSFEVATDTRQNRNLFEGNYWSRYAGYDLGGDGFGDVPHRPVRLFSVVVERTPAAMVLLRTFFVDLLDLAERVLPALTPETLVDAKPRLREVRL
jgi:nitrous oxidase accessory protein